MYIYVYIYIYTYRPDGGGLKSGSGKLNRTRNKIFKHEQIDTTDKNKYYRKK